MNEIHEIKERYKYMYKTCARSVMTYRNEGGNNRHGTFMRTTKVHHSGNTPQDRIRDIRTKIFVTFARFDVIR